PSLSIISLLSPFFFTAPPPPATYPLSLHDALPICPRSAPAGAALRRGHDAHGGSPGRQLAAKPPAVGPDLCRGAAAQRGWLSSEDRKSTRLNSSHLGISYAVFCLKKKKQTILDVTP